VHLAKRLDDVIPVVVHVARPGDVVLTLGAGSIGTLPRRLVDALKTQGATHGCLLPHLRTSASGAHT
jgi:hypothetical protein